MPDTNGPLLKVTLTYASNQWSFAPQTLQVSEANTYILFELVAEGFRFANPNRHSGEPAAITLNNGGSSFVGPWTTDDSHASLLDLRNNPGVACSYAVHLVQIETGEPVTVPATEPYPVIQN